MEVTYCLSSASGCCHSHIQQRSTPLGASDWESSDLVYCIQHNVLFTAD